MNIVDESKSFNRTETKEITLTREQLYQKVWSTPAIKLAKEFGISDVAITKICKKHNIPKPHPGYWQQVSVGKSIRPTPLPSIASGISDEIIIHPNAGQQESIILNPALQAKIDFEKQPQNRIVVEEKLRSPHTLVEEARASLSTATPDSYKRLTMSRMHHGLDIQASKPSLNRALRIMNALIIALESRGFKITIDTERLYHTVIKVAGENIHTRLIEKVDRVDNPGHKANSYSHIWDYNPTGLLQFEIAPYWSEGCQKRWSDSTKTSLENQLNDIIAGILICADAQHRRKQEREEAEQRETEKRLAREALERQKQEEQDRYKQLESQADAWQKSQNIRAFIKSCEAKFIERSGSIHPDSPEEKWLTWATAYADSLDPLTEDIINGRKNNVHKL